MLADSKALFVLIGIGIDLCLIAPYGMGILRGRIKPHFFSWLIWTILMAIAFRAQVVSGAGVGSLVLGMGVITTAAVCAASYFYGDLEATRFDKACLMTAILAIGLWVITNGPFLSVILITAIDLVAYGPTIRKSWWKPYDEMLLLWLLGALKFALSLFALEDHSIVSWLYPVAIIFANVVLCSVIIGRRILLKPE